MRATPGARSRPGRGRLSRSADFERVFRSGRSHASREFVLYVFPRGEDVGGQRLGLSVSRKVGGAVERNRVKRLLREAFALESGRLPAGSDAVVVARRDANALAHAEGLSGVRRVLGALIDRASGARVGAAPLDGAHGSPREGAGQGNPTSASRSSTEAGAHGSPREGAGDALRDGQAWRPPAADGIAEPGRVGELKALV